MKILDGDQQTRKVVLDHFNIHVFDLTDNIEHLLSMYVLH